MLCPDSGSGHVRNTDCLTHATLLTNESPNGGFKFCKPISGETRVVKIVKCEDATGESWFHLSTRNESSAYRQLTPEGLGNSTVEKKVWTVELSSKQVSLLLGKKIPPTSLIEAWVRLLEILETSDYQTILTADNSCHTVPRTRLRKFRFAFRDWSMGLKRGQAEFFADNVELLRDLWNQSIIELTHYNYQNRFYPKKGRRSLPANAIELSKIEDTIHAARYFEVNYSNEQVLSGVQVRYLDREIAPLRTPGGQFVGGGAATSTGRGGMDLLLLVNNRVCAGEVKVGRDSELFEALLQALWYGSEIATEHQISRVVNHSELQNYQDSKVDVAVFSINQTQNRNPDRTRDATIRLVDLINKDGKFTNLGTVHLFENDGNDWKAIS